MLFDQRLDCRALSKSTVVSDFHLYAIEKTQWPASLAELKAGQTCLLFRENTVSLLSAEERAVPSVGTAAWPATERRLVLMTKLLPAGLFTALADTLGDSLVAILAPEPRDGFLRGEFVLDPSAEVDMAALQALADPYQVDLNLVDGRLPTLARPGLVVLDMDSTSIQIECIDEIAKLAGAGEEVAAVTELAMQGKLDFSESLRARVAKLEGVELSLLDTIADDLPLMPGMAELAATFQRHGWKVAIASGGFTYFADRLKDMLKLDRAVSNTLATANGRLTGEVLGEIVDANVKARTVAELADEYGIEMSQTLAIGDGANDLVMMDKAALGVAFHAKPLVQAQAQTALNHCHLGAVTGLLER